MFRGYFINNQNKITPLPQPSFILLIPFFWLSASGSWEGMARMSSAALQGLALWWAVGPRNQLTPLALQPVTPLSSWAVFTPHVSRLLQVHTQCPAPVLWNKPFQCSGLFLVSQRISRFSSQNHTDLSLQSASFLPAPRTASPHFVLCLTHICVILISPVGKPWCEPPPFFPLMTVPAASSPCLRLDSFPLQPFLFCVWNLLLVNVLSSFSSVLLFFFLSSVDVLRCSCSLFAMLTDIRRRKYSQTRQPALSSIQAHFCWHLSFISNYFTYSLFVFFTSSL